MRILDTVKAKAGAMDKKNTPMAIAKKQYILCVYDMYFFYIFAKIKLIRAPMQSIVVTIL